MRDGRSHPWPTSMRRGDRVDVDADTAAISASTDDDATNLLVPSAGRSKDSRSPRSRRRLERTLGATGLVLALFAAVLFFSESQNTSFSGEQGGGSAATSLAPAIQSAPPLPLRAANALPNAEPTRVQVRSLGIDSSLVPLGLQPDRTVEVPSISQPEQAGWFKYGASPGAVGPSVILGHVNGSGRKGVFSELASATPGSQIVVDRAGGEKAVFTVTAVREFSKKDFPTQLVYGKTSSPELRLVTCGGILDRTANNYLSNIIVFATLTGTAPGDA